MDLRVFHGPDRLPVPGTTSATDQVPRATPFHGVVSRGLLADLNARDNGAAQWADICPLLEPAMARHPVPPVEHLSEWARIARSRRVLTYAESAWCAGQFVQAHAAALVRHAWEPRERPRTAELWSVKEGHTASVWQVTVDAPPPSPAYRFAVHVARDAEAGLELLATSERMRRLHALNPEGVTEILAIDTVPLDRGSAQWQVPVVATTWADQARELHVLRDRSTGFGRFVTVDRFLTLPDSPGHIRAILGTRLDPPLSDDIWAEILTRTVRYSELLHPEGPVRSAGTEINEGDWVWDGSRLRLVALSDEPPDSSLGHWVLGLLVLGASEGSGPAAGHVYWGDVERAVRTFEAAARDRGLPVETCLSAAAEACDRELEAGNGPGDAGFRALRMATREFLIRRRQGAPIHVAHGA